MDKKKIKTSRLDIKLNLEELKKLEEVKILTSNKTSSGAIKSMISRYALMIKEIDRLNSEISDIEYHFDDLKNESKYYFNSMHRIMRLIDYQQKL